MDQKGTETHKEKGVWDRARPQDTKGWIYLIVGLLLIVLILGGSCIYLPAMFAAPESMTPGLWAALEDGAISRP